jgi:hypothetical protein
MYQYALNDAKVVVNLFLIYKGLLAYLLGEQCNKDYYESIHNKYAENRENLKTFHENKNYEIKDIKSIFPDINYRCLEMMKIKLKEKYNKLNIININ